MPTLKASRLGIAKIKQARNEKGWGWSIDEDDTCLVEASKVLEPNKNWFLDGSYAEGISGGTWKRFLAGKQPISAAAFKAYCQVLGLKWEEVVERRSLTPTKTCQDWGEAIDISTFYGRTTELIQLEQWIVVESCHLVALLGMGGIGKTALSAKLAEQIQQSFEYLIWRSLRNAPPIQDILADWLKFLANGQKTDVPTTVDGRISRLIEYLQVHRCFLILDDWETVMRSGELAGQYREGYEDYGKLIRRVGQERHQSCLLLISREKPIEISSLAGATLPVRELKLKGLQLEDAKKLLETKGFSNLKRGSEELIQLYRGNPLALKIIATTIQEIFNGDIYELLEQSTLVIGDILLSLLNQHFERLSTLEMGIVYWFALENQPISLLQLKADMQFSVSSLSKLVAALESLKRRSLLEKASNREGNEAIFTLQPVVMKYVINQLIEQVCKDIMTTVATQSVSKLGLLRTHALVKEQTTKEVKQIQVRLILTRIVDKLYLTLTEANPLEEQLNQVLSMLQRHSPQAVGYAQTNILNLLEVIGGERKKGGEIGR
ncbi:MAG: NB-ARC domain-containing protein [Symploca sp. SIO2C1]|nr:NB-ARC domain-containing protein [Symploca sp. SIO2C1]